VLCCIVASLTIHGQSLGTLDPNFVTGTGFAAVNSSDRTVTTIVIQPDNKILVGGGFNSFNGVARERIARLNSNGTLDPTFFPGTGFNAGTAFRQVLAIALQPDGKVLAGGRFDSFNGSTRNGLVRLNANGSLDPTFSASGFSGFTYVFAIAVQPDGKVLLAGEFSNYQGHACHNIIRVDQFGVYDPSFQPGTGTNDVIYTMRLQENGRILLGGAFTTYNDLPAGCAVRLLPDGALDVSFLLGTGFNAPVFSIATTTFDNSILMAGSFTQFKNLPKYRVVKLDENGNYAFSYPPQINQVIKAIASGWMDDIVIGGRFTSYTADDMDEPVGRIARLFEYGPVDLAFHSYPGFNEVAPNQGVQALAITATGDVIAGGTFTQYNGIATGGIAKLLNHCTVEGPCDDGDPTTINDDYDEHCVCQGTFVDPEALTLEFQGDFWQENSFEILHQGSMIAWTSGPAEGSVDCGVPPDGCYLLRVYDSGGDGIAGGGYVLRMSIGPRIIDNRNNFLTGSLSAISGDQGFCLPLGNDRLITASCDRMELRRGVNGSCSDKLTADNTPNNTSGNVYQFWFFDPNGTLSLVYPSATGSASNIVGMNQLPSLVEGRMYNVRVRTRISPGVWREWGPACRMMIDNAAGQCASTKLQDEVNNMHLSCGQTMSMGNSSASLVFAKPVTRFNNNCISVRASKYQFRFRIPQADIVIVKNGVGANPWTYLNMANLVGSPLPSGATLQACKTYQVEVRASIDGGATWCRGGDPYADLAPWGDACPLYTDGCSNGIAQEPIGQNSNGHMRASAMSIYPNPNRGDQITLRLENLGEALTVSVDIYDAFGKRVIMHTIATKDGFVNTVLDLNGALARGLYMVNVTVGDSTYTERLVIQP